jgi:DNA repair protein RadD
LSNPADAFDAALAALVSAPIGGGLRPYQADAIHQCRDAVARGVRRVMAQLATGGGKTLIASAIASGFRALGLRVLFVVPAIELVDQTLEKFYREGLRDIGVIQAGHWRTDWSQPVQIASVQTLMRRQIPPADLVFIDEGHKWFDFYRKWMLDPVWADVPFIGLSATPWTKGLGAYYNELIVVATMQDLIDAGYLSPFVVFAPAHPDLKAVRTVAGDYHERDLSEAMNRQPLVADIVQTWLKHGVGRPTLCFAVNRGSRVGGRPVHRFVSDAMDQGTWGLLQRADRCGDDAGSHRRSRVPRLPRAANARAMPRSDLTPLR